MSTIPPQYASPPYQPERAPQAFSFPTNTSNTLAPSLQETQATNSLNNVNALLTPTNINRIMRDPNSKESRAILDQIRSLLSPANLRSMLQGTNAQANAQVLEAIGHKLGKEQLNSVLSSAKNELAKHQMNQFELQALANLESLFGGGGSDGVLNALLATNKSLDNLQQGFSNMDSTAKSFTDISGMLTKDKLAALRAPSNAGHSSQGPDIASSNRGASTTSTKIPF